MYICIYVCVSFISLHLQISVIVIRNAYEYSCVAVRVYVLFASGLLCVFVSVKVFVCLSLFFVCLRVCICVMCPFYHIYMYVVASHREGRSKPESPCRPYSKLSNCGLLLYVQI